MKNKLYPSSGFIILCVFSIITIYGFYWLFSPTHSEIAEDYIDSAFSYNKKLQFKDAMQSFENAILYIDTDKLQKAVVYRRAIIAAMKATLYDKVRELLYKLLTLSPDDVNSYGLLNQVVLFNNHDRKNIEFINELHGISGIETELLIETAKIIFEKPTNNEIQHELLPLFNPKIQQSLEQ